ncbi:MAG: PAS domain-containing sensor histidine kinase, partial [Proteobacteria bacterium]|nr:PAS domain-containing sensor histidine kinase [Pseudomonadota bacterium]
NLENTFAPGSVIELNQLGMSLENMASSIHQAQVSLKESIDRFRTVMDSLDFPVHVSDMNTHEVLFINKSAQKLWGNIVGRPCWESIHAGQTGPCAFCVSTDLVDEDEPPAGVHVWEYQNTRNHQWYECRSRTIRWIDGRLVRMDTANDVTEKKRTQEVMIQTEKMMSIGGLAAGMAHEIKNPLGGILQNTQVLRNRILGDLPKNKRVAEECGVSMEAMKKYLEKRGIEKMVDTIMGSGKRASEIIDNMLSFSRKSESRFAPHGLTDLLDQTVEIAKTDYDLKKKYDFRRIEIRREYAPGLPPVRCEGSKIQQVYLNILKNGAEAMAEAGVKNSRFILRSSLEKDMARIEIEDNGPGMDKETRDRIFEPFFTTKGIGVGTGLGLSVSYFIITKNHEGAMSVETTPGKGTNFIIRLPLKIDI